MQGIGIKLRTVRRQWGLSLREVEERSVRLAQEWGDQSCQISAMSAGVKIGHRTPRERRFAAE
jgi:hypothetical protein